MHFHTTEIFQDEEKDYIIATISSSDKEMIWLLM